RAEPRSRTRLVVVPRSAPSPSSCGCPRRTTARPSTACHGSPNSSTGDRMRVVTLAGGTGGAKLAHGLQAIIPAGDLTVVANTGDDTERHGLLVMPDHDAVLDMLADRFDDARGWGLACETWNVM